MKIIKEGNKEEARRIHEAIKRFVCSDCGCILEANKNEYETSWQYNDASYGCKCPTCGCKVWSNG